MTPARPLGDQNVKRQSCPVAGHPDRSSAAPEAAPVREFRGMGAGGA